MKHKPTPSLFETSLCVAALLCVASPASAQENNTNAMANNMATNNSMNNSSDNGDGGDEMSPPAAATATPNFNPGARAAGMGEAANALSSGTSGVFNNPAGIARAYMYSIDGTFAYTPDGNVLSAAIVDSKTNPSVSAGFGVNYYFSRGEGASVTALDLKLPIAIPVVPDRVSIGIAGRYLKVQAGDLETINSFSLDAGAIFRLVDQLHLGIAARNLIDPCEQASCRGVAPLLVGGGLAYGYEDLSVAADVEFDLNSEDDANLNIEVGAEYLIQQMVPVRLGFRRVGLTESNVLSIGSGWRSKTAGVDLSYQHDLSLSEFGNLFLGVSVYF